MRDFKSIFYSLFILIVVSFWASCLNQEDFRFACEEDSDCLSGYRCENSSTSGQCVHASELESQTDGDSGDSGDSDGEVGDVDGDLGGSDGDQDGGDSCPSGFEDCGEGCVDLRADRARCGQCGNSCAPLQFCANSQCQDFVNPWEQQIAAGMEHSCAIGAEKKLSCWGSNGAGEYSPPEGSFLFVAAGNEVSCGIDQGRKVHCWGDDFFIKEEVYGDYSFRHLSLSESWICGAIEFGPILCWGESFGNPREVPGGEFFVVAVDEGSCVCGISTDDELRCNCSSLSQGVIENMPEGRFIDLQTNGFEFCALDFDASIHCWDGSTSLTPLSGRYRQMALGNSHICGLTIDGDVDCAVLFEQEARHGQAANQVGDFVQVGAGNRHNCAKRADGEIHCWGDSASGKLNPN